MCYNLYWSLNLIHRGLYVTLNIGIWAKIRGTKDEACEQLFGHKAVNQDPISDDKKAESEQPQPQKGGAVWR